MTEAQRLAAGKQWVEAVFARLCQAYRATLLIASWDWQDEDPEYRLWLQLPGQETLAYIPSRGLGFGRGQLIACGTPHPAHEPVRYEMEAILSTRLAALAASGLPGAPEQKSTLTRPVCWTSEP
jgi:hypothetical protein